MERNFLVIEKKPDSLPSSELSCECEDGQDQHLSAQEFLQTESFVQEKNRKKKKKHKGSLQSPKQILAFNTAKLFKLDEQKAERSKILYKCPSFPVTSTLKAAMQSFGDLKDLNECAMPSSLDTKIAVLSRVASLPLKSALRGGFEELGKGPRPKLHVQWDPSVREPPCSSMSHTVIKKFPKKKGSKHGCGGGADLCMRQNWEKAQNDKLNSDSSVPMIVLGSRHENFPPDEDNDVKISNGNDGVLSSSLMVVENPESEVLDCGLLSRDVRRQRVGEGGDDQNTAAMNGQCAQDSPCGSSFFVGSRVACGYLYTEVL